MASRRPGSNAVIRTGALILLTALVGCGYAKRKDVDVQLAQLRTDMQAGDRAVQTSLDTKITTLDGRVGTLEQRAQALERDIQTMRTEFNASIQRLEGMLAFNLPVHFAYDESIVRDQDHAVLDRFAAVVKGYYPNAVVTVEGFTDPAGSQAYNLELGRKRAQAVKDYLSTQGLMAETIKVVSYGEASDRQVVPGAAGPGDEGMQNRRVSLVIDYSGTALITNRPITN